MRMIDKLVCGSTVEFRHNGNICLGRVLTISPDGDLRIFNRNANGRGEPAIWCSGKDLIDIISFPDQLKEYQIVNGFRYNSPFAALKASVGGQRPVGKIDQITNGGVGEFVPMTKLVEGDDTCRMAEMVSMKWGGVWVLIQERASDRGFSLVWSDSAYVCGNINMTAMMGADEHDVALARLSGLRCVRATF